ncbi:Serine/threonine-protein kinase [Actinidia chinensis var. chinensis]|uniref:Serine/threonine-protein kinase n=1 Tax=Actinidia chinensis var. chinensis TaxID=1590841 RepID=A0A2R6RYW9_ACTCC|nr:Serine/threonine-protein kinase [Actinidia chinensis var. chinensis]
METEGTKTLTEIDSSLSSEQAQSSEPFDSAVRTQENGTRVSGGSSGDGEVIKQHGARVSEGSSGDGEVIKTVVETEILVEKMNSGDGGVIGDAKVTGGLTYSEYEREEKTDQSVCDSVMLIGDGSDEKTELGQICVSLVLDAQRSLGSVNERERNCGFEGEKGSVTENGGDPGEKSMEISCSEEKGKHEANRNGEENEDEREEDVKNCGYEGEKRSVAENGGDLDEKLMEVSGSEGNGKHEANQNRKENKDDRDEGFAAENGGVPDERSVEITGSEGVREHEGNQNRQENEDDREVGESEDEEDMGDIEHEYLAGDFVWGKIRSHPWWPGQIYDPSDGSEHARKCNQSGRLLVAYFGDGSFSWCSRSQLKPFAENFQEMSKQSNSKSFVNAVQNALDEIGRVVELKMTCSCIPEENWIGLDRPLAMNAGIKKGVLVPEGDLSRLPVPQPSDLLVTLRYIAELVSVTNMLELTVLRSWVSAFYKANGGHKLAMYHEPVHIEGLEDKNRDEVSDMNHISGPPEEDWFSARVNPGFVQTDQSLLKKCPVISDDKLYHRRKKKSVAELMQEDAVGDPKKNRKGSEVEDVTTPAKLVSKSAKKKRKSSDDALSRDGGDFTSPSVKKKTAKTLESAEKKVLSAKNGGSEGEKETKKQGKVLTVTNVERKAKDETEKASASTQMKKRDKTLNSSAKNGGGEGEKETKKKGKVSSFENDDTGAKEETETPSVSRERKKSKYLSPPFTSIKHSVKNSGSIRDSESESVKIAQLARIGERMSRAAGQLIRSPPVDNPKRLDTEVKTPVILSPCPPPKDQEKIVVSIESNASTKKVVSEVRSAARNPLYLREKNSVDMFREFVSTFRSAIFVNGSNYKSYHKRRPGRKRKSSSSDREMPETKSQRKTDKKREAASLIVTFPADCSLPSKDAVITMFSKFGAVNEKETEVFDDSRCARVVFVKGSDAEEAFNESIKKSPYGDANVKYRLRYTPVKPADDEKSRILFVVKEKLEKMTQMLESCDANMEPEMKSNLEVEMKGLLEEVSAITKRTL